MSDGLSDVCMNVCRWVTARGRTRAAGRQSMGRGGSVLLHLPAHQKSPSPSPPAQPNRKDPSAQPRKSRRQQNRPFLPLKRKRNSRSGMPRSTRTPSPAQLKGGDHLPSSGAGSTKPQPIPDIYYSVCWYGMHMYGMRDDDDDCV